MAKVAYGYRGFLGFGEESTYGTAVARTNFLEINSESITKEVARIESAALNRRGILNTRVIDGGISVGGDFEFDAQYDGWLKIAKHAFGTVVTDQPDVPGAPTAYRHKFTIADTLPVGLTMEVFRDSTDFASEANKAFLYKGCKVASIGFSSSAEELLKVRCGIIGQDEARVAKTADTYNAAALAVYHQSVVKWAGADIEVAAFELNLNNALATRPKLGSNLTREPVPDGKVEVSGSFTMEFVEWAQLDDFYNTTQREFQADFLGAIIAAAIKREIKLVCPVSILHNWRVSMSGAGKIMAEADFKAYRTTTANELELTMVNTSTTP